MRLLIVYGTTEGHTRKIAESVKSTIATLGHQIGFYDSARRPKDLTLGNFDAIIVAGSIHQQRHQESVGNFVRAHLRELKTIPTALLSVSLSAAFDDGRPEAQSYVDEFLSKSDWQPSRILLVAGALKYSEYDYFKEQIVQHIVLKGQTVERAQGDYDFTDWEALTEFVTTFVKSIRT